MSDLKHCITKDGDIRWFSSISFDKRVSIGRVNIAATMRAGDGFMGRLGGGWSWKLGILASRYGFVLELFVMSVRVSWPKPEAAK